MNFDEILNNAVEEQQQTENTGGYQFATGGVGDYDSLFDEMSQPKQFFEQGEDVELPETPEQMAAKQSAAIRVNLKGAEFLVNNGDRLIAWLCTMFIDAEADAAAKDAAARAAASKENIKLLTSQQQQTNNSTVAIVIILAAVVIGYILIKKL